MKMGVTVKIERKRNLGAMSARVHAVLAAEVKRSAEEIRDVAKSLAAVGKQTYIDADGSHPGALRDGIHIEEGADPMEVDAVSGASYSAHVNYGTTKQAAQPFWEPAIEEVRPKFTARCTEAVRKAVG